MDEYDRATKGVDPGEQGDSGMAKALEGKRREMLDFMVKQVQERGFPPSIREIASGVGLKSASTVHSHLGVLEKEGYIRRDPTKPRAIELRYDPASGAAVGPGAVRQVPLVGDVAAGTGVLAQENVESMFAVPEELTGHGVLFMVRVRGESMIDAGVHDGDFVVVRQQPDAEQGDMVVAGMPGEEATVKYFSKEGSKVVLTPANQNFEPMEFESSEVQIFGKVVTVLRKL
ncbi:MAG: transcriptional repressor LexA [Acidimicrobiales bacterium]|jgi:repressor LexA